ncbi:hypothetical protein L1049_025610 [Liquidambar formosana]|uniref:DUF241 domain protein n=1 Tax=Liquidambar formosana TaxID=63359 RepID=A0AAP0ND78_LIQFO
MVGVFRRSLSFPNKNSTRPSKPSISHHVRSVSLPCRSHPLISHLKDEINQLKTWDSKSDNPTSAWLCDGLCRLRNVHFSLDDLLQLPQTQESLRREPDFVEKLLEDFIRFVDVYGIFQTSVMALKEVQSAAQVAIRRRDELKIALYVKALKKMAKEMNKLVSTVRCIGRCSVQEPVSVSDGDDELAAIIKDVNEVTVSVSVALFNGVSLLSSSRKSSWMGLKLAKKNKVEEVIQEFKQVGVESFWGLRKKGDEEVRMALKRMQELEGSIGCIESGSEKVFRSLINTRVSLLNVLTQ